MHAFLLILAIAGQPEKAVAICDTYKACSDEGAEIARAYAEQLKTPADFSYRIVPVIIRPESTT